MRRSTCYTRASITLAPCHPRCSRKIHCEVWILKSVKMFRLVGVCEDLQKDENVWKKHTAPSSAPQLWRWRQCVLPQRWYIPTSPHGVASTALCPPSWRSGSWTQVGHAVDILKLGSGSPSISVSVCSHFTDIPCSSIRKQHASAHPHVTCGWGWKENTRERLRLLALRNLAQSRK